MTYESVVSLQPNNRAVPEVDQPNASLVADQATRAAYARADISCMHGTTSTRPLTTRPLTTRPLTTCPLTTRPLTTRPLCLYPTMGSGDLPPG